MTFFLPLQAKLPTVKTPHQGNLPRNHKGGLQGKYVKLAVSMASISFLLTPLSVNAQYLMGDKDLAEEGETDTLIPLDKYDLSNLFAAWNRPTDTFTLGNKSLRSPATDIGARHGWTGRKYTKVQSSEDQTVVTPGENPGDDPVITTTTITEEIDTNYEVYVYTDSMTATSYSYYGYWLAKDSDQNVILTRTFYGWDGADGLPDMSTLTTGTATYTGDAVGTYDVRGSNPQSGHFDAEVTLTASFTTDKIKGTIDNFTGPTGTWSIELTETDFDNDGIITNTRTIWTMDGVKGSPNGSWKGEMLGTSGTTPRDIVGRFYGEHTNSYISGGFGVEKQ